MVLFIAAVLQRVLRFYRPLYYAMQRGQTTSPSQDYIIHLGSTQLIKTYPMAHRIDAVHNTTSEKVDSSTSLVRTLSCWQTNWKTMVLCTYASHNTIE